MYNGSYNKRSDTLAKNIKFLVIGIVFLCITLYLMKLPNDQLLSTEIVKAEREDLKPESCFKLYNDKCIPYVGFGTAALGADKYAIISHALKSGYKLFDSASDTGPWYKSESAIGTAIRNHILRFPSSSLSGLKHRQSFMITSKLHPQDFSNERARQSIENTLKNIQFTYIDVYLLHYPGCGQGTWLCKNRDGNEGDWKSAWRVLEEYHRAGTIGAIGVSNFEKHELSKLIEFATIKPHLVQSWFDPYHQNWDLVNFCRTNKIAFQSYSSLGTQWAHRAETNHQNPILKDPTLIAIAERHNKSVPQIVLRWLIQQNILVVPRSTKEAHIESNIDIFGFKLSADDEQMIRKLHKK